MRRARDLEAAVAVHQARRRGRRAAAPHHEVGDPRAVRRGREMAAGLEPIGIESLRSTLQDLKLANSARLPILTEANPKYWRILTSVRLYWHRFLQLNTHFLHVGMQKSLAIM